MSEEIATEAAEESPAMDDAGFNADAEGVMEESREEEPETREAIETQEEELPQEPEDNTIRSNLGRKVKYLEGSLTEMQRQNQELIDKMNAVLGSQRMPQSNQEEEDDELAPSSKNELRSFMQQEMVRQRTFEEQSQAQYEQGYVKTINKLGSEVGETEYNDIYSEMMKNHNIRHSDNAAADAEMNWLKAERAILRKKTANPVRSNPLKGNAPKAPLGGSSGETVIDKARKLPKFDDATLAYMKAKNITPEKAAELLGKAR